MKLDCTRTTYTLALIISTLLTISCGSQQEDASQTLNSTLKRAQAYVNQGQYRAAIIESKNALRTAPKSLKAVNLAAQINIAIGQAAGAIALLEPHKDSNNTETTLLLSKAYLMRGKYRSALNTLNNLNLNLNLTNAQKLTKAYITFKSKLSQDHYSEAASALQVIESLSTATTDKAEYEYLSATLLMKQNNIPETLLATERALQHTPTHTDALLLNASIAYKQNDLDLSDSLLSDALLSLDETDITLPQKTKILNSLIKVLSASGRSSEALIYSRILASNNPQAAEKQSKFKEAVELYKNGEYDKAELLLTELNKSSSNLQSRNLLGLLSLKKGDIEGAEAYFSKGFDPETASNRAIALLARTQLSLKQPNKVVAMLKEEVKARSGNAEMLALYGLAALATGSETEGIDALKKALALAPERYRLRMAIADYYASNGKLTESLSQLELAYKANPDVIDIQKQLLKLYMQVGLDKTKPVFYAALKEMPSNSRLNFLVGALESSKGDVRKGKPFFKRSIAIDNSNVDALYALALIELADKQPKNAQKTFLRLIKQSPDHVKAYMGLATAMVESERGDGIEKMMTDLQSAYKTSIGPPIALSQLYLQKNNLAQSLTQAQKAFTLNSTLPVSRNQILKVHNLLLQKALRDKDTSNARKHIINALKIAPDSLFFLASLVSLETTSGNITEAKKVAAQYQKLDATSARSNLLLTDIAIAENKPDVAYTYAKSAWDTSKNNTTGEKLYSIIRQSDKPLAITFLDEWATALPKTGQPLREKGNMLLIDKEYMSAITLFEKAIALQPNDVISLNNLAWLYQTQGDSRAISSALKAYTLAPKSAPICDTYGWILSQNGNKDKAITILKEALALAPTNTEIAEHLKKAKNL